jgi:acetoin utilization protein AcuB
MIVRDIMKTHVVTVEPDDLLGRAASLMRQHQFHHLPVVRTEKRAEQQQGQSGSQRTRLAFAGLLCVQDIDLAAALARQDCSSEDSPRPWQEQRVAEFMDPTPATVTPTTPVGAAAQVLMTRSLSTLPVVEYDSEEQGVSPTLVGLLTRSDLLLALARALGTFEPGTQIDIVLPLGNMAPLAQTLSIAAELHMHIHSLLAMPLTDGVPALATFCLGTINPAPLLHRLREAGIQCACAHPLEEAKSYA